jgi:hypothetical protein
MLFLGWVDFAKDGPAVVAAARNGRVDGVG